KRKARGRPNRRRAGVDGSQHQTELARHAVGGRQAEKPGGIRRAARKGLVWRGSLQCNQCTFAIGKIPGDEYQLSWVKLNPLPIHFVWKIFAPLEAFLLPRRAVCVQRWIPGVRFSKR